MPSPSLQLSNFHQENGIVGSQRVTTTPRMKVSSDAFPCLIAYAEILLMEEILHQLIGSLSHDLQGLLHPRWSFGEIPSSTVLLELIMVEIIR